MQLSSLIDSKLVFLKSNLTNIEDIYTYMVSQKNKHYPVRNKVDDLVERLMQRKLDDAFLLPNGVAIPHLHIDDFRDITISVLVPKNPIITDSGIIKILFMIFTCKNNNAIYLHVLRSIVKMTQDEHFYDKILNARNTLDFQKIIKERDLAVRRAVTVRDAMVTDLITAKETTTLKELSQMFYDYNFEYYPVLDEDNNLLGEVTLDDFLMAAFPAYTNFMPNLNFLNSFEPFERLLKDEDKLLVKSIMKPIEISITPEASIVEAVFLIHRHKKTEIPVIENGKLLGLISFMNIFTHCCV